MVPVCFTTDGSGGSDLSWGCPWSRNSPHLARKWALGNISPSLAAKVDGRQVFGMWVQHLLKVCGTALAVQLLTCSSGRCPCQGGWSWITFSIPFIHFIPLNLSHSLPLLLSWLCWWREFLSLRLKLWGNSSITDPSTLSLCSCSVSGQGKRDTSFPSEHLTQLGSETSGHWNLRICLEKNKINKAVT